MLLLLLFAASLSLSVLSLTHFIRHPSQAEVAVTLDTGKGGRRRRWRRDTRRRPTSTIYRPHNGSSRTWALGG